MAGEAAPGTRTVLVTGGTGVAGRALVARLAGRVGVAVRVLSRRGGPGGPVRGDPETGEGLAGAVTGADVIVHCASAADYRRPDRDVTQTRHLLDAVGPARPHLVYLSIVGVDTVPFGYYRAKLACEELIAGSGLPWTVLRATQFHELALLFLMLLVKSPVVMVPRGFTGQPVEVGEVANRLAPLALGEPAGRVPDLGGPRVESSEEMVRLYLRLTGKRRALVRVPLPGKTAAAFRAGGHLLPPDGVRGGRTFEDFLRAYLHDHGTRLPYRLRR